MEADYRANPSWPGYDTNSGDGSGGRISHVSRDDPNAGGVPVSPGLDLGIESYDLNGELHAYNVLANGGTDFSGTQPGDHP